MTSTYRREKISPDEIHKKPLSFFNGKIIMIADLVNSDPIFSNLLLNKNSVDYSELVKKYNNIFTDYTVQDFTNPGINTISNSRLAKLQYRPPTLVNKGITTVNYMNCETCKNTITQFTQSFPDFSIFNRNNSSKTDIKNFITNYGVNILPFRFYIDDNNLADYEKLFNKLGNCAFIKMSSLLHHYKKHSK
jgi:hypothetical protein